MKVEGPNRTQQSDSAKKKDKVSSGSSFGSLLTGGPEEASGAGVTQSIASVDVLLAVQGAEDPAQKAARRRMRLRADNILDSLEKIRIALLSGTLTVGHVIDIADVVAAHREKVMDPQMTAILDEIDLRAQIELAKMRKALDNGPR